MLHLHLKTDLMNSGESAAALTKAAERGCIHDAGSEIVNSQAVNFMTKDGWSKNYEKAINQMPNLPVKSRN